MVEETVEKEQHCVITARSGVGGTLCTRNVHGLAAAAAAAFTRTLAGHRRRYSPHALRVVKLSTPSAAAHHHRPPPTPYGLGSRYSRSVLFVLYNIIDRHLNIIWTWKNRKPFTKWSLEVDKVRESVCKKERESISRSDVDNRKY